MKNFKEIAKAQTTLSEVMNNKEKVTNEYLISEYPNGFTITNFDFIRSNKDNGRYAVYNIAENTNIFASAGTVLNRIFEDFVEEYNGNVYAASNGLKEYGGITVKLSHGHTRKGKNVILVDIL